MAAKVLVSEIFGPTVQGEGPSLGRLCGFVRLATCNLRCTWCDTKYTWDWENYDINKEVQKMDMVEVVDAIMKMSVPRIVFSGGEPMLQQKHINDIVNTLWLMEPSHKIQVEIETAGTIEIMDEFGFDPTTGLNRVQFNVSPKLAHSGNPDNKRFVPRALVQYRNRGANFKFVVQQISDLEEVAWIATQCDIPRDKIWIMPEGTNILTIEHHMREIAEAVIGYGWNLTTRLHVQIWGEKRGV